MTVIEKFIVFQIVIVSGFGIGYMSRSFFQKHVNKIIFFNLICIEPLIILNSVWGMKISSQLVVLPVTGFFIVFLGFLFGYLLSPVLFKDNISKATFTISSSLSNQGFTMGAFICYMFIGQAGLSLSMVFILYFPFYLFGFIFSYAGIVRYNHPVGLRFLIKSIFQFRNMPLFVVIISLLLTAAGIRRPVEKVNLDIVLFAVIFSYFITLGVQFEFKNIIKHIKPSIALALIKFVCIPAIIFLIYTLSGISLEAEIGTVIFIQSFMPAAVFSVVASQLYGLDTRMSSALFMVNTVVFLVIVLPVIVLYFKYS